MRNKQKILLSLHRLSLEAQIGTSMEDIDIRRRLEEIHMALENGVFTVEHHRQIDDVINFALRQLPVLISDGHCGSLSWRESLDQPEQDVVPVELLDQLRDLVKGYEGNINGLFMQPDKRAALVALFPGLEENELPEILAEVTAKMKVRLLDHYSTNG